MNNNDRLDKIKNLIIKQNNISFEFDQDKNIINIIGTHFIKNILYFLFSKDKIEGIFSKENTISKEKFVNDIFKKMNNARAIHPFLFLIFYQELSDMGIEYKYLETIDTFELRSNKIIIRQQNQECFKIIEKILSDNKLKDLSQDLYYYFLTDGIKIEEYVNDGNKMRFIDMTIKIYDNIKLFIEINESHHNKELDIDRATNIYLKNNTLPIDLYKEELDFNDILDQIWKEISFGLYNYNQKDALTIYLHKVDHFDLALARFFVEIQINFINKDLAIPLKLLRKFVDKKGFVKKKFDEFINSMLESKDLTIQEHFINFNQEKIRKSLINSFGFDRILQLPRTSEWSKSIEISKSYSKFRVNYQNMIEDLMSSGEKRLNTLKQSCINYKKLANISDISFQLNQNLIEYNSEVLTNQLDIKLHPKIWCLKYNKGSRVPFYQLEKVLSKKIVNYIKLNTETKQNILNYKIINSNDLLKILDVLSRKQMVNSESEESDSESDLEEEVINLS